MATKVYDPDQISVMICGIPIIGGFADGSMVDIEQDEDDFTEVVGTMGDVTRSKKNNKMTTITVRLLQASTANSLLSALANTDAAAPNGAGIGPSEIKDLQGTSVFFFDKSWIAKVPKVSFDAQDTPREWKIRGNRAVRVDGSN